MTTIIADARLGVMLSDSHWTDGTELGPIRKVWRYQGELVGMAGTLADIAAAREWFRRGRKGQPPRGDVTAIGLSKRGIEVWTATDGFVQMPDQWAIGSGGKAARAALMAGASPGRAMQIVKLIDSATGGPTRIYKMTRS